MAFCASTPKQFVPHRRPALAASSLIILLAACAPIPVQPPDSAGLAGFTTADAVVATSATADIRWWRHFGDDQLDHLVDLALQQNFGLQAARARVNQYQALVDQAAAALYPEISGTVSSTSSRTDNSSGHRWSAGLSTSYELDFWGRLTSLDDKALFDTLGQDRAARVLANTVAAQTSLAWFGLIHQQQLLGLLDGQQQRTRQLLEAARGRYLRGQASAADVWQQQQLLESLDADIRSARFQQQLYAQQLAVWTASGDWLAPGAAVDSLMSNVASALPDDVAVPTAIALTLLRQRPDVEQAWFSLQSANALVAAAAANRYPRLTLTASLSGNGESLPAALDNWVASLVSSVVMPLFDAGSRRAALRQQQAVAEVALYSYQQTLLEAAQEVRQALVNEASATSRVDSLLRQLELAERTESYQTLGYRKGAVSFIELLNAQKSRLGLEVSVLNARWLQLQQRIQLYRSLSHGDLTRESVADAGR